MTFFLKIMLLLDLITFSGLSSLALLINPLIKQLMFYKVEQLGLNNTLQFFCSEVHYCCKSKTFKSSYEKHLNHSRHGRQTQQLPVFFTQGGSERQLVMLLAGSGFHSVNLTSALTGELQVGVLFSSSSTRLLVVFVGIRLLKVNQSACLSVHISYQRGAQIGFTRTSDLEESCRLLL